MSDEDRVSAFIAAACVPLDASHASGTLEHAEAIRAAHPEVASASIHAAAVLGDEAGVRRFVERDRSSAVARGGPHGWDPLTSLCFSRYLRLERARSKGFLRAAEALLDAGASAATGFRSGDELESAIYGAAGVAHDAELTRLLLERGADPNDGETPYHAPETYDNGALRALVESGKLNHDSLATMLLRKADWHDRDGIEWLLQHGADPNRMTQWGFTALHQAARRDNALENFQLMLDHGADPSLPDRRSGRSAAAIAACRGRGDVLELLERRGIPIALQAADRLIAACARNDTAGVRSLAAREPQLVAELRVEGGRLLGDFAGTGNTGGLQLLLELGVDVRAEYAEDDGYWGIGKQSAALHVAAWRARHAAVKLLIERGADVNATDAKGRTPLALAVLACVDSYWTHLRSPESVQALLAAGASPSGVRFPSGYADVDELLGRHGAGAPRP